MKWPVGAMAVLLAGVASACAVPSDRDMVDDGVVESAHLRITTSEDDPICAGTAPLLEGELSRIAEALALPLWPEDDKLDVRLGVGAVESVCEEIDSPLLDGCVDEFDGEVVVASAHVANVTPHELVHAVRRYHLAQVPRMFEEGLAELLAGSDGFPFYVQYPRGPSWPGPAELLAVPPSEFDGSLYGPSASFLSWLWLTRGRSELMALVNDPRLAEGDPVALFEAHYGLSLADAEQGWRDEDGPDPVWGAPCVPERTYTLDGVFELSGDFDCRDPSVYGATISMALMPMCLVVPETTRARFSLEADYGRLAILEREPCEPGPTGGEARQDKYVEAGEVLEQDIAGCRYRMLLSSYEPGFPATRYTIRIEEIAG